jgi:hypothetical protein
LFGCCFGVVLAVFKRCFGVVLVLFKRFFGILKCFLVLLKCC